MGYCSCGNWVDEGSICSHCGSALTYDEPDEDDENEYNPFHGRYEYFIRQGKTCSIKGDHKTAIKFYEEAMNYGGKSVLEYIADEYVAMGDYSAGLQCWNELCPDGDNDISRLYNKGKFLKRIGKYDDAIKIHKKQLNKVESKIDLHKEYLTYNEIGWYFNFINEIIDSYSSWGKYDLADNYRKVKKQKIDVIVNNLLQRAEMELEKEDSNFFTVKGFYRDALNLDSNNDNLKRKIVNNYIKYADRAMKNGQFAHASQYYEFASELNPNNNELKRKLNESNRIYQEDRQSNGKLSKEAKRKKEREEREKKYEQQRIAHEKWEKEFEERKRKRKEECEKNPDCIKKEIQHFKKKVLKDYYILLHFEHYQKKSDIKFREILEYEDLLEKLGVKENYSREDFNELKKENKRIKYILSHVNSKYRDNGVKLFIKNQKKIDELEKRYPEENGIKNIFKGIFSSSDSSEIRSLEIEIDARDKMQKAKDISSTKGNADLQEARNLLAEAKNDISNFLKNKNPKQYQNLISLKIEINQLEEKITELMINANKNKLFLIDRNKYSNNQFDGKPGTDLKLQKEDSGDTITIYHEDTPIGIVFNNLSSDFEKLFSNISELQYLPKVSAAKYYLKYGRFEIIEVDENAIKKERARLRIEQEKILNNYPKEELITIIDTRQYEKFKKGMKFTLKKDSDNKKAVDAIGVYLDNNKIGFVANRVASNCRLTTLACLLKNIPDVCHAEYLMKYDDNYHIAWIINKLKPVNDYISEKEYNKAIIYIDHLLITEHDNIDYWTIKCSCYEKLNQYEDVDNCYDKLIELDSNNIGYWKSKASNLTEMKRFDEATECLKKASAIFPNNSSLKTLIRETLKLKGKHELKLKQEKILNSYSKDDLITIVELDDSDVDFKEKMEFKLIKESDNIYGINVIAVYLDANKIGYVANGDNATCEFTTDANDIEDLPEITYAKYIMNYCDSYHVAKIIKDRYINLRLANRHKRKGEYSKALDCYNEVLELNPDDEYSLERKAELLCSLKRWDEALKCYDMMGDWSGKASVFIEMGNYEDAFNCYDAIDDLYGKAIVLVHMGRYEEALECCGKLVGSLGYVRNLREIGRLLIDLEKYDEAIECLDMALSEYPNEHSVLSLKEYALSCLEEEIFGG